MAHNLDIIQEGAIVANKSFDDFDSLVIKLDVCGYHYRIFPPMLQQPGYSIEGPGLWAGELTFVDALDRICDHAKQYR